MTGKNFMAFIVSTTLLFVCAFGTLNCGGGGGGGTVPIPVDDRSGTEERNNGSLPQDDSPSQEETETSRYLEQNISSDTEPESLDKGSTSIITKRYLLALTDENAPAFQEAFARGAIFTLTRPTQAHIDKLREILSLEPAQVIPEDAQDPHAEIYAITSRTSGGGMSTYEYVADSSANVITEILSDDEQETISDDNGQEISGDSEVPASFFTTAESDDTSMTSGDITSDDVAKRRAKNFLEWTKSIDEIYEETLESSEQIKAQISASAGVDLTEYGLTVNSTAREASNYYMTMTPRLDLTTLHSFNDGYDYYCLKIGGKFTPNYQRGLTYQSGYATGYNIEAWLENGRDSGIELLSTWPTTPNKERTISTQYLLNLGGEIGANTKMEGDGKLSAGVSWGKTTTTTASDYDILDNSIYGRAEWEYQFTPVYQWVWSNPSLAARSTLEPDLKAVWRVSPSYWRNKGKKKLKLNYYYEGTVGYKGAMYSLTRHGRLKRGSTSPITLDTPAHVAADPLTLRFGSSQQDKIFTLTADENWRVSVAEWDSDRNRDNFNQYWVSLENVGMRNNEATNGKKEIIVRVMRNRTRRAREAHIYITGRQTGSQLRIRILQDA